MQSEGVEVPSHPLVEEAPSTVVPSPEGKKEVSDRQRAKNAVAEGVGFIKSKYDNGFFDASDKVDAKKSAEKVLAQVGENNLDSDGLKAFFNSMSAIGGETDEVSKAAAENMRVKVGDRMLTLDEWREELKLARNPTDGSAPDLQKIGELESGRFGYIFPKDSTSESENAPKEKSPEDNVIANYRQSFEEEFKKAEARGDVPQEQMEKMGETLVMLRLAEEAGGDAGVIFKHLALKNLKDEYGVQGLDQTIDALSKQVPIATDEVCKLMDQAKADEFRNAIKEGKLADLIKSGKLLKIEGMRELLFGKDMTEEKLKEILRIDKKKKWKDLLLLALIILLIGPMEMGKEVVPLPK